MVLTVRCWRGIISTPCGPEVDLKKLGPNEIEQDPEVHGCVTERIGYGTSSYENNKYNA